MPRLPTQHSTAKGRLRFTINHATIVPMTKTLHTRHRLLIMVGSLGPLGHLPASGTVTVALIGPPLFWLVHDWPWPMYILLTLSFALASVWLHSVGDKILGEKDSRKLVWDELAGFLFALPFLHFTPHLAILAVLIERVLDITKVPPANWIEKRWPGGWGVVGDDVVAGLYTCAILHAIVRLAPGWVGITS
jgi:phosphatidylglycerophosphatase A